MSKLTRNLLGNRADLRNVLAKSQPGQILHVSLMREGVSSEHKIELVRDHFSYLGKIHNLLSSGQSVNVIVITGAFNNVVLDYEDHLRDLEGVKESWLEMSSQNLVSSLEAKLLKEYREYESFKVIERSIITNILEEVQFSSSGYISPESRTEIGTLTGADYIVYVSGTRSFQSPKRNFILDVDSFKLISIATGEILASNIVQMLYDKKDMKVIKNYYKLN